MNIAEKIIIQILGILLLVHFLSCKSEKNWSCVDGNCENGIGKRLWKDGGYEKGKFKNGLLEGHGYQLFGKTSGFANDSYDGEFKNDRYNGKGIYHAINSGATYIGYFKDGMPEGKGSITFDINSKWALEHYEGDWKKGKKDGFGIITYSTKGNSKGGSYTGEWKNDKKEGKGKYYYSTGSSYEGDWSNDVKEGYGIHIDKNGKREKVHCHNGECSPTAVNITSL